MLILYPISLGLRLKSLFSQFSASSTFPISFKRCPKLLYASAKLASIFIVCIPIFLVTSNVRWVIDTPLLYSYGFDKYDTAVRTGIERDELIRAGKLFRDYFNTNTYGYEFGFRCARTVVIDN